MRTASQGQRGVAAASHREGQNLKPELSHGCNMPSFSAEAHAGELFGHTPALKQQHSKPAAAGLHPALIALQAGRLGVAFGGAGFGAAYELGAAHMLSNLYCLTQQGTTAVLSAATPVAGELPQPVLLLPCNAICLLSWHACGGSNYLLLRQQKQSSRRRLQKISCFICFWHVSCHS